MGHDHEHSHTNHHADATKRSQVLNKLYAATALCAVFLLIELIGGYMSGSLAILSDAAHLFADLASFAVAIGATHLATLPTTDQHTFGLKRVESLAALFSMVSLAIVSIGLALEALRRIYLSDGDVNGKLMSGIASIGVLVNVALAWILGEHHVHLPGFDHHEHGHEHGEGCHESDSHEDEADHCHDHVHEPEQPLISPEHDHNHCHSRRNHDHSDHDDDHDDHDHDDHDDGDHNDHDHDQNIHHHHHDEETAVKDYGTIATHPDEVLPQEESRNINLHAAYLHVLGDLAQSIAVLISGIIIWFQPTWTIVDPIVTLLFCAMVFYSTLGVLRTSIAVLLEEVPPNISWREMYDAIGSVEGVENVHDLHIWSISHDVPTLSVHAHAQNPQLALREIYKVVKSKGIEHATIQVQSADQICITCSGMGCDTLRLETLAR